jgi:putative transposase
MASAAALAPVVGVSGACQAVGVGRASFYRHARRPHAGPAQADPPAPAAPRPGDAGGGERPAEQAPTPVHPRALSGAEQQAVLAVLHAPRFRDAAPAAVYATLLDEGVYLASERTMYRLLAAAGETRERRDQLVHPPYAKPELLATAPNEVWSWDIERHEALQNRAELEELRRPSVAADERS